MLLSDFFEARREKRIAAAREEAKAEGFAEGMAEGIAEGMAEGIAEGEARAYRKFAEWERRRREAEDRGEEFTEPPPTKPPDISQENSEE